MLTADYLSRFAQFCPHPPIPKILQDSEDEAEQAAVQGQAQVLMDMMADLITHEGADGLQVSDFPQAGVNNDGQEGVQVLKSTMF